jgi:hypothetical protein
MNKTTQSTSTTPATPTPLPSSLSLLGPAWNDLLRYWLPTGVLVIVPALLLDTCLKMIQFDEKMEFTSLSPWWLFLTMTAATVAIVTAPMFTYFVLRARQDKEEPSFSETFFRGLMLFWRYVGISLLTALLVIGGLVLFIMPGLILLRRYFLAPYYLIDENLGIGEAMRKSSRQTKPYAWVIWTTIGAMMLVVMSGALVAAIIDTPVISSLLSAIASSVASFVIIERYVSIAAVYRAAGDKTTT